MKKMIAAFLSAVLLLALAGCASQQPDKEAWTDNQTSEQIPETEILEKFCKAQKLREILTQHKNVTLNAVLFDAQGNDALSIYRYADSETYVREDSNSNLYLQNQDGYYFYDPASMENMEVAFGMEGVFKEEWEKFLDEDFEYILEESDQLIGVSESDGRILLTIASDPDEEFYRTNFPEGIADEIEPGTQAIIEIEIDAETYMVYNSESYLKKPDGTKVRLEETHFSYDITPYEPSEELLQVINGTDKIVTLIADPGTEQEKKYVKSCGENGTLLIALADGYNKIYKDEACTQESEPSDENGERTLYTVKES